LKSVEKSEKKPFALNLSRNTLIGLGIGLVAGVGLTFATSCYSSGWWGYLAAAVLIVLAGAFGYWVAKNEGVKLLFHEDVYYRIGGYAAFGLILFFCAWALFFFVIKKNNLLYDSFIIQKIFKSNTLATIGPWGEKTFGKTWLIFGKKYEVAAVVGLWGNVFRLTVKYFFNHLVFIIPFIFLLNCFKIGKWNLSLIYFGCYSLLWGVAVGTGSLPFPVGDNQMAGALIVFARYGLWIWFAYLLLAASTTQFAWLTAPSWLGWNWRKERKFWPVSFTPDQREVFIYGLLFLLAASFAEARIFMHYNL